jgi:hypothetical protein
MQPWRNDVKASPIIAAMVAAALAAASSGAAAQPVKGLDVKNTQPNACADGFLAPGGHDPNKAWGQGYTCLGPKPLCSSGFQLVSSSTAKGRVTYLCQQPLIPPVPPHQKAPPRKLPREQ